VEEAVYLEPCTWKKLFTWRLVESSLPIATREEAVYLEPHGRSCLPGAIWMKQLNWSNGEEAVYLRVYAQTSFYQENLAFCFQLCTVTHFVGFLPLPWFSCSLVFFPYSCIRFGGFFVSCMEKNVGGLFVWLQKLYLTENMFEWLLSYIQL
jgi:hypothetical protein